ncbi:electron transport complex subunit RsxA [Marinicella meishanensis]|uniref:electron transport complex subunit RsxA n=1 Tax=Marinicella meishanensis TaxID=2873263 RepID=UPI001CC0CCBE|nr:electron transport complex subunit RsxA [Marinicella sp. NBU2979]
MSEIFLIFIGAAFVNNFVLVRFLGLCPFMGVSTQYKSALGMAFATAFVLTLSSIASYLVNAYLLEPFGLTYLKTLSFILVIAVTVQITEMVLHKTSPLLYQVLGLFLPLITTNCAVLGVALLNVQKQNSLLESAFFGFGAAFGFGLVLVLFATIRERLEMANIPDSFRGLPIALMTAGIMSLAFMGFAGMTPT